jgi:type IV pilus assembly protein PilM
LNESSVLSEVLFRKLNIMPLPFSTNAKEKEQLVSIDLGSRTTKAVYLQRRGAGFTLSGYAVFDAPIFEKSISVALLSEHLKTISQTLGAKTKYVTVSIGVHDSVVRPAELPLMSLEDMRQILKNNTKTYLQQDLPGYVFDCFIIPPRGGGKNLEKPKSGGGVPKTKVLAAGAKKQLVEDLATSIKNAGLIADHIVPTLIGPVNAFEIAMPESFSKDVVALVDVGFKNTTICLLQEGELILSRVVNIGGDRITSGLAELMSISYAEAEGIKVGMPAEVQSQLESLILPLGRELRASLDFFEHQQDKVVSHVYLSGGSARSDLIVQILQSELAVECKIWNPTSSLQLTLPPQQISELEQVAPQLCVAIGSALAAF